MKNARVFLAEDEDNVRTIVARMLGLEGHTVELVAVSLPKALENVKLVKEKEINVAILDGSLSKGSKTDGSTIAAALRKENPKITIISFSADIVDWGDRNVYKSEIGKLPQIIADL